MATYSNIPDELFMYDGTNEKNTIFDPNNKYSPFYTIKNPIEIGAYQNPVDVSENIFNTTIYNKYYDALTQENNEIFKPPSQTRFFATSGKKCINDKLDLVDQNYIIDSIQSIQDPSKNGLFYSANKMVDAIDANNINYLYTIKNNKLDICSNYILDDNICKNVELTIDKNGNKTKNNISTRDYNKHKDSGIIKEAFVTVSGYGYDYKTNYTPFYTDRIQKNDSDNGYMFYDLDSESHSSENINNVSQNIIKMDYLDSMDSINNMEIYEELEDNKKHHYPYTHRINYNNNIISNFFVGSVTVLGLYIIFRFMDKKV